jgi:type VI secretion system protein ImpH
METDPALETLLRCPQRFEFAQAIRVLLRQNQRANNQEMGQHHFDWAGEPVRMGGHQSLAFPTADIQSIHPPDNAGKLRMLINFLGLTGPSGVLPHVYTQHLMHRVSETAAARDFFDIFNHRLAMLFYYAWEKYRFAVLYEQHPERDVFRWILLSLVGLASEHLQECHTSIPDDFFIKYAALLALQPRSASALRAIIAHFFRIPVEIDQFAGGWFHLDDDTATRFRDEPTGGERLGFGAVVGREYWSQESAVLIRLGPMSLTSYRKFLPDELAFKQLAAICRFFSRDEIVFDAQLILDRREVPRTHLATRSQPGDRDMRSRLGWTTWARKEGPASKHAADLTVRLH